MPLTDHHEVDDAHADPWRLDLEGHAHLGGGLDDLLAGLARLHVVLHDAHACWKMEGLISGD